MERDVVCFSAPLNICFPLSYGTRQPEKDSGTEDSVWTIDELFGED